MASIFIIILNSFNEYIAIVMNVVVAIKAKKVEQVI